MSSAVLASVRRAIARHRMFPPDGRLVAAVSGGPDSMALLDCLCEIFADRAPARIIVAHLNHLLRRAADQDAAFVAAEAERRSLRCILGREDVRGIARSGKRSIEDAARRARYAFLLRTALECGAGQIALGHTADDQAETVLLQLLRGTGLRGLGGMRAVRPASPRSSGIVLVRPLLAVTRAEIEAFIAERHIPHRTDESNLDTTYRRNRVRHEIMPLLRRSVQPNATRVLCRLAELAGEAASYLEEQVRARLGPAAPRAPFAIPSAVWTSLHPALRGPALSMAFAEASEGGKLQFAHIQAICSLAAADAQGSVDLPGAWRARVEGGGITLVPQDGEPDQGVPDCWGAELTVPGTAPLPDGRTISATVQERGRDTQPPRRVDRSRREEWIDYDAVGRPTLLAIRPRRAGDSFVPLGARGHRTVKRFLIDAKVPRRERRSTLVVALPGAHVVWLAPHRLDERAKVTETTSSVLVLRLE